MKSTLYILICLSLALHGCGGGCEKADGPRVAKNVAISQADKISLNFVADMSIRIDSANPPQLKVIAQEQVQDLVLVNSLESEMLLNLKGCVEENDPVLLQCDLNQIKSIDLNSAGKIESEILVQGDEFRFENNGLGDIDFVLDANRIIAQIKSSGDIIFEGYSKRLDFLSTSSGDLRAYDLQCDTVNVHLFGSSVCDVYTDGVLNIYFYDDGRVNYRGNPKEINITGEGQVTNENL